MEKDNWIKRLSNDKNEQIDYFRFNMQRILNDNLFKDYENIVEDTLGNLEGKKKPKGNK